MHSRDFLFFLEKRKIGTRTLKIFSKNHFIGLSSSHFSGKHFQQCTLNMLAQNGQKGILCYQIKAYKGIYIYINGKNKTYRSISRALSRRTFATFTRHPKQITSRIKRHHKLHSRRPQLHRRIMQTAKL